MARGSHHTEDAGNPTFATDERNALVLDEARRAIDQQKSDLIGLRTKASASVGYATIVGSFIAGLALDGDHSPTAWTWVGLAALVAAVVGSVCVMAPHTFVFNLDIEGMDSRIGSGDTGDSLVTMQRNTSLAHAKNYDTNSASLRRLHRIYLATQGAVLTEVLLLLIDLARR